MKLQLIPITISLISLLAGNANAVIPVTDYGLIITTKMNQVVNYIKMCEQYVTETETQINTNLSALRQLQELENQVIQMERYGDPATLKGMAGVQAIAKLQDIYQQAVHDFQEFQALSNPDNAKTNFNQILSQFQQPEWNGWKTSNGALIAPGIPNFQFPTAEYNIAQVTSQQIAALAQKKLELTQQRDAALSALDAAKDSSTVQKQHSVITALSASIAEINEQMKQVTEAGNIQRQQTQAAQQISQTANDQHITANGLQSMEQDLLSMPTTGVHTVVNFNSN